MTRPVPFRSDLYGGRAPITDRRDCGVRALSVAAAVEYLTAHAACAARGRRNGRGMHWHDLLHAARDVGAPAQILLDPYSGTLTRFVAEHPAGHWLVFVSGHFLAVVNGTVHDWPGYRFSTRRRVKVAARLA